jgi:hypothetical protein
VLWSFWTAESVSDWLALWTALGAEMTVDVLLFPTVVLVVILLGNIERNTIRNTRASEQAQSHWMRARFATVASLIFLVGVSIESVSTRLGPEVATAVHSLRSGRLSRLDSAKLERGYYENLLSVDRFNSQLWEVYTKKPANWLDVQNAGLKRFTGGFEQTELVPSFVSRSNYGMISTNRWGMRDQDYERKPPANTYRIAMLGASLVMGWGVGDGETFEALLERRLNAEQGPMKYERLNFGVPGYQPLQQLVAADKALTFSPDAIFYIATGREGSRASWYLVEVVQKNINIPYEPLRSIVVKAGLKASMDETTARKLLQPFRSEILCWMYKRIVEESRAKGVRPVLVFLPQVREGTWQEETPETLRIAEVAGFIIINLAEVYKDQDITKIRLAEWDDHPNLRGHQLIASRLYEALKGKHGMIIQSQKQASTN